MQTTASRRLAQSHVVIVMRTLTYATVGGRCLSSLIIICVHCLRQHSPLFSIDSCAGCEFPPFLIWFWFLAIVVIAATTKKIRPFFTEFGQFDLLKRSALLLFALDGFVFPLICSFSHFLWLILEYFHLANFFRSFFSRGEEQRHCSSFISTIRTFRTQV